MSLCLCPQPQAVRPAPVEAPAQAGVIIVAAGSGERFGRPEGKALVPLAGRPMLAWSLLAADAALTTEAIVVVCRPQDESAIRALAAGLPLVCPVSFAAGGATRQESVAAGIAALDRVAPKVRFIAVHDGARPLVLPQTFEELIDHLLLDQTLDGAIAAQPAVDTLKVVDDHGLIETTPDRARLWCAQTPQIFKAQPLKVAHAKAAQDHLQGTDDASLLEAYGFSVACVSTQRDNLKVTVPEDLIFATAVLSSREEESVQ